MSALDQPSTAPDRMVVAAVAHYLEPGELVRLKEDGDRVVVMLEKGAAVDALASELSWQLTQYLRASWLYVGNSAGDAT